MTPRRRCCARCRRPRRLRVDCQLPETSVIMDNTSHKAAREAVDLEVVDADLVDLVILCAHGLGRPRAS